MVKTALIIYVRFATRTHTVNIYIGRNPLAPIGFLPIYIYSVANRMFLRKNEALPADVGDSVWNSITFLLHLALFQCWSITG